MAPCAGQFRQLCWPLLADVCATLRPGAATGVPAILTAAGVGPQLAALVRSTVRMEGLQAEQAEGQLEAAAAEAWAALACLPHAAEGAAQAAACCGALVAATRSAADSAEQPDDQAAVSGEQGGASTQLLMLHCRALGAQAELLGGGGAEGGSQVRAALLPQALSLLERRPRCFHAVSAAAAVLAQAAAAGAELDEGLLRGLAPALAPNLSAAAQPLRRETLRALCCFRMPPMLAPAGSGGPLYLPCLAGAQQGSTSASSPGTCAINISRDHGPPPPPLSPTEDAAKGVAQPPCDALQQLLALEERQQGADGGRPSVVALGRMRSYLEYRRLPDWMVPLVVHELLGVLHIR
jgi:U3 small nucleolar RNA-associated protein 20